MPGGGSWQVIIRRLFPLLSQRGRQLKNFSEQLGLVYFGAVNQHDDDYDPVRGFTTSLKHIDAHFAVGDYNGRAIRLVDRLDTVKDADGRRHQQFWTIIEISLTTVTLPRLLFVPHGRPAHEYYQALSGLPRFQSINDHILPGGNDEFSRRYQVQAKPSALPAVGRLLDETTLRKTAAMLWPHAVEQHNGKLYLYITQHRLDKAVLEATMTAGLWLADILDAPVSQTA